jgi:DNA-binding response OmpR family regulator
MHLLTCLFTVWCNNGVASFPPRVWPMPQKILCVSYDDRVLLTRRQLLEQRGYNVTTALGFKESVALCGDSGFDLLILGTSIPHSDKVKLMNKFRQSCAAPVLSLWRTYEPIVDTVDYIEFSDDPAEFVKGVGVILTRAAESGGSAAAGS